MHKGTAGDAIGTIVRRCSELFGSIAAERAAIRLAKSEGNMTIIKCRLDQLDKVLMTIALADPPMAALSMSGSMKRLQRRH